MANDAGKHSQLVPTQFKKKTSGNPGGVPRLRGKWTKKRIEKLIAKFTTMDAEYFREYFTPGSGHHPTVEECMLGSIISKVMTKGCSHSLELLFQRTIGKVTDHIETTTTNAPQIVVTIPGNGSETPESTLSEIHTTENEKLKK